MSNITKDEHLTKMGICVEGKKIKNNDEKTKNNVCRHTDEELGGYNKYFYHHLG